MTGRPATRADRQADKAVEKLDYATMVRSFSTEMAKIIAGMDSQAAYYFDNGFNTDGANEISDEDIAQTGITAAQLADMVNFMQQYRIWLDGGTPLVGQWKTNINNTRNVAL